MKKIKNLVLVLVVPVLFFACGGGEKKETAAEETQESESASSNEAITLKVDGESSVVKWEGTVVGVYGHYGVIDVKEGTVNVSGDQITSGQVTIDMTTIQPQDSASYSEENPAEKLVGHLSTGDFFLVDSFPTATFKIKSHMADKLIGDLTIRGNTNEEIVQLDNIEITESGLKGEGKLVFDRQKYGVNWKHYIQDYILSDDITLELSIVASK